MLRVWYLGILGLCCLPVYAQEDSVDCAALTQTSQAELHQLQTYVDQVDKNLLLASQALAEHEIRQQQQAVLIEKLRQKLQQFRAQQPEMRTKLDKLVFGELAKHLPESPIYEVGNDYVRLLSDSIFELADDTLTEEGKQSLKALNNLLKIISVQLPRDVYWRWQIQAHTDNKQMNDHSPFNNHWALSAAQAASAARYFIQQGMPRQRIHVSALAGTRLLAPGTGNRIPHWKNRRLEIRLILEK